MFVVISKSVRESGHAIATTCSRHIVSEIVIEIVIKIQLYGIVRRIIMYKRGDMLYNISKFS